MDFLKTSLPSPVFQAFANSLLTDLNTEETENLLRIFGAKFEKDRSPYKLLRRGCK